MTQTAKMTSEAQGNIDRHRQSPLRCRAARAAYARDFVSFVQAHTTQREITKSELLRFHRDFVRTRTETSMSEAQLFRALSLAGVHRRQVDLALSETGHAPSKTGRRRQTMYRFPRRRHATQPGVLVQTARPSARPTSPYVSDGTDAFPRWPHWFLFMVITSACVGGPLLAIHFAG